MLSIIKTKFTEIAFFLTLCSLCFLVLGCVSESVPENHLLNKPIAAQSVTPERSPILQRDFIVIGTRLLAPHPDLKHTTVAVFRGNLLKSTFELPKNEFQGAIIHKNSLFVLTTTYKDQLDEEFLPSEITQYDLKNLKPIQSLKIEHSSGLIYLPYLNQLATFTTTAGNTGWTLIQTGDVLHSKFQQISGFSSFNDNGLRGSDSLVDIVIDNSSGKISTLHKSVLPNNGNQGKRYFFYVWDAEDLSSFGGFDLSAGAESISGSSVKNICYPQPSRISAVPQSAFLLFDPGCDQIYTIPSSFYSYNISTLKMKSFATEPMNGISYEGAPFATVSFTDESSKPEKSWVLFRNETPSNLGIIIPQSGIKYFPKLFSVTPWAFDRAGIITNKTMWAVVEVPSSNGKSKFALNYFTLSSSADSASQADTAEISLNSLSGSKTEIPFDHSETPMFLQSIPTLN